MPKDRARYSDQVAVVTGAASGIGKEIAVRLGIEGARVSLWDFNAAALADAAAHVRRHGAEVATQVVNVSDEGALKTAFEQTTATWGRLDVLVNAAGIVGPTNKTALDYELDDFRRVVEINLVGSFLTAKYAVQCMRPRKYGRILLLASMAGKDGNPGMAGYVASKAGVIGLVKGLGKEFATTGITVNGLAPGVIATPMNQNTAPAMLKYMLEKIPMQRMGSPEEAAALACWICSPEASFTTGFTFDLSGGRATY
jgi:NAD(P)-dependent dehydrogenase (short-subunit alcohol dehydrogenase family)